MLHFHSPISFYQMDTERFIVIIDKATLAQQKETILLEYMSQLTNISKTYVK